MHIALLIYFLMVYFVTKNAIIDNDRTRKRCCVGMGIGLFLFAALRSWTVGSDTWNYFADFCVDSDLSYAEILIRYEGRDPFFHLFSHAVSLISNNPQFFMAVVSAIVAIGFSVFAYKQKGNLLLIYGLFVTFRIFSFTCTGLRQAIAMGIIFFAYTLLDRKNLKYGIPLIVLASLFHTSAILALLMIPLKMINKNGLVITSCILIGVLNIASGGAIASFVSEYLFVDRFSGYLEKDFAFTASSTFILYVLMFIVVLFSHKTIARIDNNYWPTMRILGAAIMFSLLGQALPNLFRLSYYFIFPLFALFGLWVDMISRKSRVLPITFFVILSLQYIILGTGGGVDNYEYFWDNPYRF